MIYLTGDIHGLLDIGKVVKFFNIEKTKRSSSKSDYLIVLGDVAVVWDNAINDELVKATLKALPVKVLYLDGNHENHFLLEDYNVTYWNGEMVHVIRRL
ncbi:Calcineurin-like phosphoesterase [compost metagenome]